MQIAIVGTGWAADRHARGLAAVEGVSLSHVVSRSEEKARTFAETHATHGVPNYGTQLDEICSNDSIAGVVLATPNALHFPHAKTLIEHGKHLLIEKPMAMNATESEALRALAHESGRKILVGHMWRFDREAQHVRAAIARGDLGDIVKVKSYGIHALWGPSGWFVRSEDAGGGALIDMGVHAIDTVRYLLGDPDPTSVYARIETRFGDYDVDDVGVIIVNWSCGATSIIESGWHNPHMDGPEASTQLFGTKGYARLFPTAVSVIEDGKLNARPYDVAPRKEHCDQHIYDGQMQAWIDAIREDRSPIPGPDHGHTIMKICDAAYLSSRENRVVEL